MPHPYRDGRSGSGGRVDGDANRLSCGAEICNQSRDEEFHRSPAPTRRLLISIRRAHNHALDDVVAQRRHALRASRSEKVTRQSRYQSRSKRGLRSRGRKLGRVPHCSAITSPSRLALRGTLSPVATSTTRLPGQIHGRQDR